VRSSLARYRHKAELHLAVAFRKLGEGHAAEADVYHTCNTLAKQCEAHSEMLGPFVDRYSEGAPEEPDRHYHELFDETRSGGLGLIRDLHDLYLMAHARLLRGADGDSDRVAQDEDEAGRPAGAPSGILTAEHRYHDNGANLLEKNFRESTFYEVM
jgi:hypothetical protein